MVRLFDLLNLAIVLLNNRVHLSERLSQATVNENRKLLVLEGVAEFTLFDLLYASRVLILIPKQVMKSNLTKTSLIFT